MSQNDDSKVASAASEDEVVYDADAPEPLNPNTIKVTTDVTRAVGSAEVRVAPAGAGAGTGAAVRHGAPRLEMMGVHDNGLPEDFIDSDDTDGDDLVLDPGHEHHLHQQQQDKKETVSLLWVYFWWLFFGFGWVVALHWAYLALLYLRERQRRRIYACLAHMGSYWVASILFLVFRTEMGMVAVPCADGAMSRDCFMNEQPNAYKVYFVLQAILIAFCLIRWIVDACWIWTLVAGIRLRHRQGTTAR